MRPDGRQPDELRPFSLQPGFSKFAEGSCLMKLGDTHVLVTATVEDRVPGWRRAEGGGWLTAEYSMLPRSGRERNQRELMKPNGRTMEIQRLIGRSLRAVTDLSALGERTITPDCDAIQADGGTRTAAVTAAFVATYEAQRWLLERRLIKKPFLVEPLAAVSVGVVMGQELLDLCYEEDSRASTDMNVVMTASGKFVEIQGTAESEPFTHQTLAKMLGMAKRGIDLLIAAQKEVLGLG